ncbi:hypothetical protein PHYBOEH_003882 [Phytophthora boehmeriae]|uniref:RxLR effector protein n=1 Tax=Phytophthora boehmeriae TaxID=109152 RepID=A0A8T1WMY5_9STRA|nr:hypothetical protein PHYBOEH_003882 [Phytophthora boehmeriae]
MSNSDAIKLSEDASPNELIVPSTTARDYTSNDIRSLRGVDKAEKDHISSKVSSTDDGEERVVSKADLITALRITDGDAKVLRKILKGRTPEHILTKLNAPFKVVNDIKVYPKDSPEYDKYLFYVKYARNDLPDSMFHRS